MRRPVIQFNNFSFKYRSQIEPTLKEIQLTIYEGEKVVIVGPSGSGKSTLAHCINGLVPFSYEGEITGSLFINQQNTATLDLFQLSTSVGTVLQDPDGQFIGLSVGEDLAFVLENDAIEQTEMKQRVQQVAETLSLEDKLTASPHELSGGQRQRVALGGVIINDVDILLFDEPLANLDPATGQQAMELIDEIHQQTNCTTILVEHRLEDVLHREVDRIIVIDDGRIVADDSPDNLLSSDVLERVKIREPLYIKACKLAGCTLDQQQPIANLEKLDISTFTTALQSWSEREMVASPEKREPILELKQLNFHYDVGVPILKNINCQFYKGEMVAIVGQNGAGKSTLSKLLGQFEKANEGQILFNGQDISQDSIKQRAERIGIVLQNPNHMISKHMIFDEVALGLQLRGVDEKEIEKRVHDALHVCGLYPFRNWPIAALSFGQKKRLTIASILVLEPEIILLDEPTAGQDYKHYSEMMLFLERLKERGVTIILITHDMHIMLEYADRSIVMKNGEIIFEGSPIDVLTNKQLVEDAYLKETSLFHLATKANIHPPLRLIEAFISTERERRSLWQKNC